APTKFFGTQTDRLRDFVHMTFQRKDTLRRAESAKSAVRRHVRRYCFAMNANIRTEVRTGGMNRAARKHDRRERAIRAAIDHKFDLHREQLSVFRDRSLVSRARRMALSGSGHIFSPI